MKRILFILAITLIISSCRKNGIEIPGNISHRITRVNNLNYPELNVDITYDATGRILKITDSITENSYEYQGNTVKYTSFSKISNSVLKEGIITLNNHGYAASCDLTEYPAPNNPKWAKYTYEYNAEGN